MVKRRGEVMIKSGAIVLIALFLFLGVCSAVQSGETRRIEVDFRNSDIRTRNEVIDSQLFDLVEAVSYTHLTLPTNREV